MEEWNGMDPHTGSFNHYSYGAVCDFLFSRTVGIRPVIEKPGYQEFIVEPVTGESFTEAKAVYEKVQNRLCRICLGFAEKDGIYQFQLLSQVSALLPRISLQRNYKSIEDRISD